MTYEIALELTGYFASILILVSLLMSSAVKLRVLNAVGALVFTVYGLLIGSYPTAFLNGVSVIVDIYYIVKLLGSTQDMTMARVGTGEAGLQEFLRFYRDDIGHHFGNWDFILHPEDAVYMVFADAAPVGLLIGKIQEDNSLQICLDYSVPRYRDCSVGRFLYQRLAGEGIRQLTTPRSTPDHEAYLQKVGFILCDDRFVKTL